MARLHSSQPTYTHIFLTILWYVIIIAIISLLCYLFVRGSSLFLFNREREAVHLVVERKGDFMYLSGTLVLEESCVTPSVAIKKTKPFLFAQSAQDELTFTLADGPCSDEFPLTYTFTIATTLSTPPTTARIDSRLVPVIIESQ
jgi:hypothetical protein